MRIRPKAEENDEEVPITPLIDCVFLLIIFFLVTSMFKRFEMLIPIQLPDQTSALSTNLSDRVIQLAIDEEGNLLERRTGSLHDSRYNPVEDFATYLQTLGQAESTEIPLEISVARQTHTQKVIDALDIAQIQGFTNVSVRTLPENF